MTEATNSTSDRLAATVSAERPRNWVLLVTIVMAALMVRCAFVLTRRAGLEFPDEVSYMAVAGNFLEGKGLIIDEDHQIVRAPLYPLFLALCRQQFAAHEVFAIRIIQCLIGALTCWLVYRLGRAAFNTETGEIAAVIAAVYPFFVFYCGLLLTETLFVFLFVLLLCSLARLSRSLGVGCAVWTGIVWGATVLLRASMLTFMPFLLPFWLILVKRRIRGVLCWIVCVLFGAATVVPWVYRNYQVTDGKFVPTTLMVGPSLFEANSELATGGPAMDLVKWPDEISEMNEYERNRFLLRKAVEYMRHHPRRTVELAIEKLRRTWNTFPNFEGYRSRLYRAVSAASYGPVLAFAVIGLIAFARPRRTALLLCVPVVYFTLMHSVFVGSTRYRTPLMPILMVFAACPLRAYFLRTRSKYREDGSPDMRVTRKRLRVRLACVLFLAAAAAVGLMFGKELLEPGGMQRLAERTLAGLFDNPVSVDGVRVTPTGCLQIDRLSTQIGVPGGRPAAIGIEGLSARPRLLSLLTGRPALGALELDGLSIEIERDPKRAVKISQIVSHVAMLLREMGAPAIVLRRGKLRVSEGDRALVDLTRLRLLITPERGSREMVAISGVGDEARFGTCRIVGRMNVNTPALRAKLSRSRLALSDKLLGLFALPSDAASGVHLKGGTLDAELEVQYDPREHARAECRAVIHLRDAEVASKQFAYPLRSLRGHVVATRDRVVLRGITGKLGHAPLRVLDTEIPLGSDKGFQVSCYVSGLPLSDELGKAGSPNFRKHWERLQPTGKADVVFRLTRDPGPSAPVRWSATVQCRGGTVQHKVFPVTIRNVTGTMELTGTSIRLSNMRGEYAGQAVRMSETLVPFAREAPYEMRIAARNVPFDEELHGAIPSIARKWWEGLTPSNTWGIEWTLYQLDGELASRQRTVLDLSGATFRWKKLALPISVTSGKVASDGDTVQIDDLRAKCADAAIAVSGRFSLPFDKAPADISFSIEGLHFDDQVKQAIPKKYHEIWDRLRPKGQFGLRIHLQPGPAKEDGSRDFKFDGEVTFRQAHFHCGVDIDRATGAIYFRGTSTSTGGLEVVGTVSMEEVLLEEKLITDLRADFGHGADELVLHKVRGECFGGLLTGGAQIGRLGKKRPAKFDGSFKLADLDIGELTRHSPIPVKHMAGLLSAETHFSGQGDVDSGLHGGGSIRIREGKLGELPRLLGLINLFHLASIDAPAFHSANVKYDLQGEQIVIREIDLLGDVLNLRGKGEVKDGKLDFRFIPEVGPRLPVVDAIMDKTRINKLIGVLKNRLIPVKLKGSYADPIWRLDPLTSVARTVQGVFRLRNRERSSAEPPGN